LNTQIAVAIIGALATILAAVVAATIPSLYKQLLVSKSKQKETDDTLHDQQKQLDWTVNALSNIIAYMPGYFAHQALCQIRDKDNEYYDDSNGHKKRILLLLLDNGYLQPPPNSNKVVFSERTNGKRLFELAALTPMAELFLQFREEVTKKSSAG
jgi:Tol biopolymer transport system component